MAGRGGRGAARTQSQKRGGEPSPGSRPPPTFAFARLAILTTLLLMAVYTAFAVARIQSEPTRAGQLGAVLPGEAQALAARLDAEAATLRGGLLAAREGLEARPESPLEAAETGLRVASGSASAVIIRWHIQHGFSVLPRSTNPDHIRDNYSALSFELSEEQMAKIDALDSEDGRMGPEPGKFND